MDRCDVKKSLSWFFLFLLIFVGIVLILLFNGYVSSGKGDVMGTCGDSSFYDSCSFSKPLFCSSTGVLAESSSMCGCPEGYRSFEEGCISDFYTGDKKSSFDYFFEGEKKSLEITLYAGVNGYVKKLPRSKVYFGEEIPQRADFKLLKIDDEIQKEALRELIYKIQNLAPDNKEDQVRIVISLVQNIPYSETSEKSIFSDDLRFARFPYQVLYENAGSCEGKSELLVLLLREMGYGTSFFYYGVENHESVGIKCPVEKSLIGSGYCFVETTAPSILGDFGGDYPGTGKLSSNPQVVFMGEGVSLSEDLKEYKDSKTIMKLRRGASFWNLFKKTCFKKLNKGYGLGL